MSSHACPRCGVELDNGDDVEPLYAGTGGAVRRKHTDARCAERLVQQLDEARRDADELRRVSDATIAGNNYAVAMAEGAEEIQRQEVDRLERELRQAREACPDCADLTRANVSLSRELREERAHRVTIEGGLELAEARVAALEAQLAAARRLIQGFAELSDVDDEPMIFQLTNWDHSEVYKTLAKVIEESRKALAALGDGTTGGGK